MFFLKHLNAFIVYIVFLLICSSILINGITVFPIINTIIYLLIHFLMIYIGLYHFKKILYLVFFICGIIFDIFLINEIGPHLIVFMLLILLLNNLKKFLFSLSSQKMFLIIILILFCSIIFEMLIALLLFNYTFEIKNLFQYIVISIFISYPTLYFFDKVDRLG